MFLKQKKHPPYSSIPCRSYVHLGLRCQIPIAFRPSCAATQPQRSAQPLGISHLRRSSRRCHLIKHGCIYICVLYIYILIFAHVHIYIYIHNIIDTVKNLLDMCTYTHTNGYFMILVGYSQTKTYQHFDFQMDILPSSFLTG